MQAGSTAAAAPAAAGNSRRRGHNNRAAVRQDLFAVGPEAPFVILPVPAWFRCSRSLLPRSLLAVVSGSLPQRLA